MRLMEADINGFGQLNNRRIDLDAPVVVVFGPNEAGKSTLFGFIRTMLYGFAKRNSPAERQEPLHGGRHGGRLLIRLDDGVSLIVQRYADDNGGRPLIRAAHVDAEGDLASGHPGGAEGLPAFGLSGHAEQPVWERYALGGVGERLFRQLYAITLSELQETGALSGKELGQYLYQAGWDDGEAIAAAEKRLIDEMESLFKFKGTTQAMYYLVKELEGINAELRQLGSDIDRFNDLKASAERTEHALELMSESLPEVEARFSLLSKAVSMRELWLKQRQLGAERERLSYTERLPGGADKAWEELMKQREAAQGRLRSLRQEVHLLGERRAALRYDRSRIELADETTALLQSAERLQALKLQVKEWEADLSGLDDAIAGTVARISPEWTERQLRELVVTVADRDVIRGMRDRLDELRRGEERLQAEQETLRLQEREAALLVEESAAEASRSRQRIDQAANARYLFLPQNRESLERAWHELDDALRERELDQARLSGSRAADEGYGKRPASAGSGAISGWLKWGAVALGVVAIAMTAVALTVLQEASSDAALMGAAGAGAVAAAMLAASLWSKRSGASDKGRATAQGSQARSSAQLERRVREALAKLLANASAASAELLGESAGAASADDFSASRASGARSALHAAVRSRLEELGAYERLEGSHAELQRRRERLTELLRERGEVALSAVRERQATSATWSGWLIERALPPDMSPEAALEVFELAEQALQKLREYDRLEARIALAKQELADYRSKISALCGEDLSLKRQAEQDEVLALRLLQADIERNAKLLAEDERVEARLHELQMEADGAETEWRGCEQGIARLVGEAGLDNEAHYAAALDDRRKLEELDTELMKLTLQLGAGISEERMAELERLYAELDEKEMLHAAEEARAEAERLHAEQRELLETKGSLRRAMDDLQQEDKRRSLLQERELLTAKLDRSAERYAVLATSLSLIRHTKRVYEEERQPIVFRHASRYISSLTSGRYVKVIAHFERSELSLVTSGQEEVESALLSRGTAEQLYLSMRLALARETSGHAKLPLMLDDPFVNFDKERLTAGARLVAEIADERQLIYFTCHEHVRDELLSACSGAKLVDMTPMLTSAGK